MHRLSCQVPSVVLSWFMTSLRRLHGVQNVCVCMYIYIYYVYIIYIYYNLYIPTLWIQTLFEKVLSLKPQSSHPSHTSKGTAGSREIRRDTTSKDLGAEVATRETSWVAVTWHQNGIPKFHDSLVILPGSCVAKNSCFCSLQLKMTCLVLSRAVLCLFLLANCKDVANHIYICIHT